MMEQTPTSSLESPDTQPSTQQSNSNTSRNHTGSTQPHNNNENNTPHSNNKYTRTTQPMFPTGSYVFYGAIEGTITNVNENPDSNHSFPSPFLYSILTEDGQHHHSIP
eukprot:3062044-Ditylum_brightwellii.AAC.1